MLAAKVDLLRRPAGNVDLLWRPAVKAKPFRRSAAKAKPCGEIVLLTAVSKVKNEL